MDTLLSIARAIRLGLYDLSSFNFFGIEIDIVLHFGLGAVIFVLLARRYGGRRAALLLGLLIISKEIVDLFLKSQIRYIRSPTPAMLEDIGSDVLSGVIGGGAGWFWQRWQRWRRWRRPRRTPGSGASASAAASPPPPASPPSSSPGTP